MKQIEIYLYEVRQNEAVTFEIEPVGVGPRVAAADSGREIPQTGDPNRPNFTFVADRQPGKHHYVMLDFTFLAQDPEDAYFNLILRGSNGGQFTNIPVVHKHGSVEDPLFRFKVL